MLLAKGGKSYELEPRKGYVRFFRTFFVLPCNLFHLAPSPAIEGTSEKDCFRFLYRPTAGGLRSYSCSSFRTAHETSYRREVLFCSDAVRQAGGNFALRILSESGQPWDRSTHRLQLFCGFTACGSCSFLPETSSSLNSSPVLSIARMIVRSLRAVATTAAFFRWFWPPTICS
jgi:hypothetical protein